MLFQAIHDIIGNAVPFFFSQPFAKSAHKFARASQRKSDGKAQQIAASTHNENRKGTQLSTRFSLKATIACGGH